MMQTFNILKSIDRLDPGGFFSLDDKSHTRGHSLKLEKGGRRSPTVAYWASDHWVVGSNPLRGKFRFSLSPASDWPSLA